MIVMCVGAPARVCDVAAGGSSSVLSLMSVMLCFAPFRWAGAVDADCQGQCGETGQD